MARPKSEFLQAFGKSFKVFKRIADVVLDLGGSDEDLLRLLKDNDRVRRIGDIIVERPKVEEAGYFTPISDVDVPEQYQPTVAKYRKLAAEHGVSARTAVCYRIRSGFTLKVHAPKFGACYDNFAYLQNWNFTDEPTSDSLVFWVPRVLRDSTSKTRDAQVRFLAEIRTRLDLPSHHLTGFGKVALLAGLILAHFKATGERIPLNHYWVRTDTCHADGDRLLLGGFDGAGLGCGDWSFDVDAYGLLGVFALGVEVLGT